MKISELKGMMRKVYDVCMEDNRCCSDDRRLIWEVWTKQLRFRPRGMSVIRWTDFSKKLASPETIRRSRQKLQEHGFIPSKESIRQAREQDRQEVKKEIKSMLF